MAGTGEWFGNLSGRPRFALRLAIAIVEMDVPNNRARWDASISVINLDSSKLTWQGGRFEASMYMAGITIFQGLTPEGVFDFRDGAFQHFIHVGSAWINYPPDGNAVIQVSGGIANAGIFGSANAGGNLQSDRIPKAPSKVPKPGASTITDTSVQWTFTGPSDDGGNSIKSFTHQIATDSGFANIIGTFTDNVSPASRTGLDPGTDYYIRFRANNDIGSGAWSDTLTMKTAATQPGAPSTPTVTGVGVRSMTVAWTAPSDTGGSAITGYDVNYGDGSFTQTVSTTSLSRNLLNLVPGETYFIKVRAKNAAGAGPWSNVRTQATDPEVPAAPSPTTLSGETTSSMTLAWTAPSYTGGAPITGYDVQRATDSGFTQNVATIASNTTPSQLITGLTASTLYYFRVRAKNSAGPGAWSTVLKSSQTLPAAPPTPTRGTTTTSSIAVAWGASSGGGAISGYDVQRATNSAFTTGVTTRSVTNLNDTATGLSAGTTYYFRVRAKNASGEGAWSGVLTAATLPGLPSVPVISELTISSLRSSWEDAVGGAVTGYDAQIATNSAFTTGVQTIATTALFRVWTGLQAGKVYYVRVRAKTASGPGNWTAAASARTLAGGKVWTGTEWATSIAKVWTGTEWKIAIVKVWDGTEWKVAK